MSALLYTSCFDDGNHQPGPKKYPADVAVKWINLQQKLTKKTTGFAPVAARSFAYSGLTLYESIVPGIPGYQSVLGYMGAPTISPPVNSKYYHWPASANAAMADIFRNLFASTSVANFATIDSLEAAFNAQFQGEATAEQLEKSIAFGKLVAAKIFEWSKTDGAHEGYKPQPNTYVPPVGPGLWIPTPPAFAPAIGVTQGTFRSFVPGLADATQPVTYPIPAYSEVAGSDFHNMVNELYVISQSLTAEDVAIVKAWADLPANYSGPGHHVNIATQLIVLNKLNLDKAAQVYAKVGIALNDAGISVFKTKYIYNLIRPISYIRNVMGYTTWNTVIATPAHPEYGSGHAVLSRAASTAMESVFGEHCSFTDYTHEALYGARSYATLEDYSKEGAWSRVLGGLHYIITANDGLIQGKKVGDLVNNIPFKKSPGHD